MLSLILLIYGLLTRFPRESTLRQRLAAIPTADLPIDRPVVIHWDDHHIPFVEAETDSDLAFALGMIHAHLRLGQMELMRRISQGRLSEMVGPLAVPFDHVLRILELGRATPAIEAQLPDDTREWIEGFVRGINHYQDSLEELPHEHRVLGLAREPWRIQDTLAIARLISTDVHWFDWLPMLKLRRHEAWSDLWRRLVESGSASRPSFRERRRMAAFRRLLSAFSRWGSNSFVVSSRRSATGSALIASDPHVTLLLPNLWLIAGYKSPSYHAVGLMFPGLPILALGRNERIAWGGTNMYAASSDLFHVSKLDASQIRERRERVPVRWWFDRTVRVRETDLGPVISDAAVLGESKGEPFALKWVGHDVSDEVTAFLRVNRATDWESFRAAFATYAVSGQNMLYADVDGNIGQVLAVRLPVRKGARPDDLILDPKDGEALWDGFVGSEELPHGFNPPEGFLVSANNRPVETDVPIGFFFTTDDRIHRITELLDRRDKIDIEDLKDIQRDVLVPSAIELKDLIVDKLAELGLDRPADHRAREVFALLNAWDGRYRAGSRGALAFEIFVHQLTNAFFGRAFEGSKTATYASSGRIQPLIIEDIARTPPERLAELLASARDRTAVRLRRFVGWGDMHRLGLFHSLGALPLVGRRYRFLDHPAAGSSETVMKTAHGATDRRHYVPFGASARHITDMKDLDRNYFVLLGGQDGWFRSPAFMDQVPLWLERGYIQVPMRLDVVRERFKRKTVLEPKAPARAAAR